MYSLSQLKRLRWGVFATVLCGIAASVAMNILHAPKDTPTLFWGISVAQLVAAAPPVAVFGSLEWIARIPSSNYLRSLARIAGAATVALGAAAISYAQQRAAVLSLGFASWEAWIWPGIIDGFMVVSAVSLVEVIAAIRELESAPRGRSGEIVRETEAPEALAYREAAAALNRESRLSGLNGKHPAIAATAAANAN